MKNNKLAFIPGLSLFLCFCLLRGFEHLVNKFGGDSWLYAVAEILTFILPSMLVLLSLRDQSVFRRRLRRRTLPPGSLEFAIKLGAAVAAASVLADLLISRKNEAGVSLSVTAMNIPQNGLLPLEKLMLLVVVPAFVEELFLRGSLMAIHEQAACTGGCILFSGAAFAILYGSVSNFAGPFIMGTAYAFLVYSFDNIWLGVMAHMTAGLYYLGASWIAQTYGAFDIWQYFMSIDSLLMLFLLYITLRSEESLLLDGCIPQFERGSGFYDMLLLAHNPGVAAFVIAFLAKAVLHWI